MLTNLKRENAYGSNSLSLKIAMKQLFISLIALLQMTISHFSRRSCFPNHAGDG
jgi:hypothetical protein